MQGDIFFCYFAAKQTTTVLVFFFCLCQKGSTVLIYHYSTRTGEVVRIFLLLENCCGLQGLFCGTKKIIVLGSFCSFHRNRFSFSSSFFPKLTSTNILSSPKTYIQYMEEDSIPRGFWIAIAFASVACSSAIILSLQRAYDHKTKRQEEAGPEPSPLHFDDKRDLTVPFADNDRAERISLENAVFLLFSIYNLYSTVQSLSGNRSTHRVHNVVGITLSLATWLYAFALALTSQRHKLPNDWGFVLNCHLCVIYFIAWCTSIYNFYALTQRTEDWVTWSEGVPQLVELLLSTDLLYITSTARRGQPFLDENGRVVARVNVSSIFSFLFFTWIQPLIDVAYKKKQLEDGDLDTLPPIYRGYNLFYMFGATRGRGLLYRIFKANQTAITIQVVTGFVASLMYYLPAYFIGQLLLLIQEIDAGKRQETGYRDGFLLVLGLGVCIIALGVIVGQLWYWGNFFPL